MAIGILNLPDSRTGKKSIPSGRAAVELLAVAPVPQGKTFERRASSPARRPVGEIGTVVG